MVLPRLAGGGRRRLVALAAVCWALGVAVVALAAPVLAHSGSLRTAAPGELDIPTWLFLLTGGGAVGASFLLASFVTDRRFIRSIHDWGDDLGLSPGLRRGLRVCAELVGLAGLGAVLVVGLYGPDTAVRNLAILVVWVGWWGGYVATTYLLGNTWPALNPFRTLAELVLAAAARLPRSVTSRLPGRFDYPERLGAWPSVAGLLALIWVEVVSPLADEPRLLAGVVAAYGAVTVAGAVAFGTETWFDEVDPVARVFRYYGRVAPVGRRADGSLGLRLPAGALTEARLVDGLDEVAFVVTLLFVTTYDGFVGTGPWAGFAETLVGAGLPPLSVYLGAYLLGFALFLGVYWAAAHSARRYGGTYLTAGYLARRFAPSLLPIAAGYHLAHNLGYLLTLLPALGTVALSPLDPVQNPPILAGLPGFFGGLELAFVLVGHLAAIWVAHATAYELFPRRLDAVRSQYGVTLVMVLYTMTSLWIVSEPPVAPPYL
jgi:hypothetical protein